MRCVPTSASQRGQRALPCCPAAGSALLPRCPAALLPCSSQREIKGLAPHGGRLCRRVLFNRLQINS